MKLPKFVYESLPALYIVGGIAAMHEKGSIMAFSCGLLLGITGVVILFIRRNYRATQQLARS